VAHDSGRRSLRMAPDGRLVDATGQIVPTVHAFGIPTEGPTYFNHYLPSPRSRAGAFERLRDVIEAVLGDEPSARIAPSAAIVERPAASAFG
jgi:hypothetical protein